MKGSPVTPRRPLCPPLLLYNMYTWGHIRSYHCVTTYLTQTAERRRDTICSWFQEFPSIGYGGEGVPEWMDKNENRAAMKEPWGRGLSHLLQSRSYLSSGLFKFQIFQWINCSLGRVLMTLSSLEMAHKYLEVPLPVFIVFLSIRPPSLTITEGTHVCGP